MRKMGQTARYGFSAGAVVIGLTAAVMAVGCKHSGAGDDANSADNTAQPTEDQLMQMADDTAKHTWSAPCPGNGGPDDLMSNTGMPPTDTSGGDAGATATATATGDGGAATASASTDGGAAPAPAPVAPPDNSTAGPATEVGTGPIPPLPAGWQTLTSSVCGITINMPVAVKEDKRTSDQLHQYTYRIPGATEGVFVVSCTIQACRNMPNSGADVDNWLDGARDTLDGTGNTVSSETNITLNGYSGREEHVALKNGGTEFARGFLVRNRSIVIIVGGAPNAISDADAASFIGSLRLIKK